MYDRFQIYFGPVKTCIEVPRNMAPLLKILRQWFSRAIPFEGSPDLMFRFHAEKPQMPASSLHAGPTWVNTDNDAFSFHDGRAWRVVCHRSDTCMTWDLHLDPRLVAKAAYYGGPLFRMAHHLRSGFWDLLAGTFMYREMLPALSLALLEKNATLVHASSLHNTESGDGVVFAGWGGCGKTSLSAQLYLSEGSNWKLVSDDLAIVSADGTAHFNPMPLNIYPYNIKDFGALKNYLLSNLSFPDRLHWEARKLLLGDKSVVRRLAAPESTISFKGSNITKVVFLQRSNNPTPALSFLERSNLIARCLHIMHYELRKSHIVWEGSQALTGRSAGSGLIGFTDWMSENSRILNAAFSSAELSEVTLPLNCPPSKCLRSIDELLRIP